MKDKWYHLKHRWWFDCDESRLHITTPFFEIVILDGARRSGYDTVCRALMFGFKPNWSTDAYVYIFDEYLVKISWEIKWISVFKSGKHWNALQPKYL